MPVAGRADVPGEKNPAQKESRSFGKGASVPFETLWCPVDHHHGMCGILLIGAAGNWAFSGTAGGDAPNRHTKKRAAEYSAALRHAIFRSYDNPHTICQNLPESTLTSAGAEEG